MGRSRPGYTIIWVLELIMMPQVSLVLQWPIVLMEQGIVFAILPPIGLLKSTFACSYFIRKKINSFIFLIFLNGDQRKNNFGYLVSQQNN